MKRLLGLAGLLVFVGFAQAAQYDVQTLRYRQAIAAHVATATVIIDLSNTTNWNHDPSKELHLYDVRVGVDKAATSTCTVKLGVVTFSSATQGNASYFLSLENTKNVSNTNNEVRMGLGNEVVYNLRVKGGVTPYIFSNDTISASSLYQSSTTIPSALGTNVRVAAGDLVLYMRAGAAAITVYVELKYKGED